jgi:DNA-binding GntR family transcriptional regulator
MVRRIERPTRADAIYQTLRRDILTGRYGPGTRLPFQQLSARYGASTGVLREVFPRLVEQGLVESGPQLGFRVAVLSDDRVRHLTEARVLLESICLTAAIKSGSLSWESEVLSAHHTLSRTPVSQADGTINLDWVDAHARFHRVLLSGAENAVLRELAESLRALAELGRTWTKPWSDALHRDTSGEHQRIAAAVLARDTPAAVAALSAHLRLTSEHIAGRQAAEQRDDHEHRSDHRPIFGRRPDF